MRCLNLFMIGLLACLLLAACKGEDGEVIAALDNEFRLVGRFNEPVEGEYEFTWPNSAMEFRFVGTGASIHISSEDRVRFSVSVDQQQHDLWVSAGEQEYILAENLADTEHLLRITRISESFSGVTAFTSSPLIQGQILEAPSAPSRKLLVLGDSITAGYGVEGANEQCGYSMETSNSLKTYASFAAQELGADLHSIAWSGIGVWRSYGESSPEQPTLLERYALVLGEDFSTAWSPSDYVPSAVLVNIGTNDYWDGSAGNYRQAMQTLLTMIERDYTGIPVYLIVSPLLTGNSLNQQRTVLRGLQGGNVVMLDLGQNDSSAGLGCDYHPNTANQRRLSQPLVQRLRSDLGW